MVTVTGGSAFRRFLKHLGSSTHFIVRFVTNYDATWHTYIALARDGRHTAISWHDFECDVASCVPLRETRQQYVRMAQTRIRIGVH